tara:strand:- start:268 stop:738 length:471 start_codon:yes stop_codon:yes gene_type:complete
MLVLHAFLITGIAFEFNYLWENIQCSPFFIYLDGTPTPIAMFVATIGGVAMTWFVHCVIAIVSGRWLWLLGRWRWPQWRLLLGTALVLSFLVEQWALATGRWTYTNINPRIPDTSISALPVAQLVLLFPLTFGLSRLLPRSLAKPGGRAKTYSRAS